MLRTLFWTVATVCAIVLLLRLLFWKFLPKRTRVRLIAPALPMLVQVSVL